MTKHLSEELNSRLAKFVNSYAKVYEESPNKFLQRFTQRINKSAVLFANYDVDKVRWMPVFATHVVSKNIELIKKLESATPRVAFRQVASSWLPVLALDVKNSDRVLDACAAPGGKTLLISKLAANIDLTANDASFERLCKMRFMHRTYGLETVNYINKKAEGLGKIFEPNTFDKILLDVPCSGEGEIFTGDVRTYSGWNTKRIERLVEKQRRILHECWNLLKIGGKLVYSTCTISPLENEIQIQKFLNTHADAKLEHIKTIESIPRKDIVRSWGNSKLQVSEEVRQKTIRVAHEGYFEAFYYAALTKLSSNI